MSSLEELKQTDIVSFLVSNGYPVVKETTTKAWFLSPIHSESKPSFCVFKSDNRYVDFGVSNRTGDILDLVMQMNGCDLPTAIAILKKEENCVVFEPVDIPKEPLLVVSKVLDRYIDPRLLMYLKSRCIPEEIYSKLTKEVHYSFKDTPDKIYSGVGFKNDDGGWEIRNSIHKYATSPKQITTVNDEGHTLNLFEGFINYASSLVYFGVEQLEGTTIVLNGLGMTYRILPTLNKYQKINCFLDHGVGGDNTTDLIRSVVGSERVFDQRYLYPEPFDFNDLIVRINK